MALARLRWSTWYLSTKESRKESMNGWLLVGKTSHGAEASVWGRVDGEQ